MLQIAKFAELLEKLHSQGKKFVLVVGGGKSARNYVAAAKSFGATNFSQDELGIMLTRANAFVFIQALQKSHPKVLADPLEAMPVLQAGKIPVFGGLMPSFTTDAVAALVAEAVEGEFVNLTDVDGIFSSDPKKTKVPRLLEEISFTRLFSLLSKAQTGPGQNFVIDLPCANILKRSSIRGIVLNGNNLENFEAFINGQEFVGTVIRDSLEDEHTQVD